MKWLFLFSLVLVLSCQVDRGPIVEQMIEDEVQKRIDRFLSSEKERCLTEIMTDANRAADSILRANPVLIKIDSLSRPPRVPKPVRPEFVRPLDTVPLAKDSLIQLDS